MHLYDGRIGTDGFVEPIPERVLLARGYGERPASGLERRDIDTRIVLRVFRESFRARQRIAPPQERDARLGLRRELCVENTRQGEAEARRNRFAKLMGYFGPLTAEDGVVLDDAVEDSEVRSHKRIQPGDVLSLE